MQTPHGTTALMFAASAVNAPAVFRLLVHEARMDLCTVDGKTALDLLPPKSKWRGTDGSIPYIVIRQMLERAVVRPSEAAPPTIESACTSGDSTT
eukprot:5181692-Prymnesium_polylepis.1